MIQKSVTLLKSTLSYQNLIRSIPTKLHIFGHLLLWQSARLQRWIIVAAPNATVPTIAPWSGAAGTVWFRRKPHKYFRRLCSFFGKSTTILGKNSSLRDSLFFSRNRQKRFHRKMLKTCMSFLLEFVCCAFFTIIPLTMCRLVQFQLRQTISDLIGAGPPLALCLPFCY